MDRHAALTSPPRAAPAPGLFVVGCLPGSPSARAGLRYGDVLVECNGLPVDGAAALESARHQSEAELEVVVLRQGEAIELTVRVEPRPERRMIMQHQTLDTSMPLVEGELF